MGLDNNRRKGLLRKMRSETSSPKPKRVERMKMTPQDWAIVAFAWFLLIVFTAGIEHVFKLVIKSL